MLSPPSTSTRWSRCRLSFRLLLRQSRPLSCRCLRAILRYMAEGAVAYAKELGCEHPEIVLHLDHGDSFELCKDCIDMGFSSVMYDGSSLPYEENIKISRQVVEYAHKYDVTVECELGVLAGVEDEVVAEESHYTKPEEVIDFSTRATRWPSLSAPLTALTSSSPSSAPATRRLANSFPRHSHSTCSTRSRRNFPDSPSCSTDLLQYLRTRWTPSTSTAVTCPMQLVSPRSNFVRPQRALSARSTSTQTLVWL